MTLIVPIDPVSPEAATIAGAAALILGGGLVAFPTETVYGLGANALDADAVRRIFAAKQRPAFDPLIVHVADAAALPALAATIPDVAWALVERFWPGPLTLVLPRTRIVPDAVTAGGPTVAVRAPAHPVAQALLRAAGVPIAAPSANLFSHTSPTTASHVSDDLNGRVDLILDGGPTPIGVESTVVDLSGSVPTILRPGGITFENLRDVIGQIEVRAPHRDDAVPLSPGLLDRHYSPRARMLLFAGPRAPAIAALLSAARDELEVGRLPVIMAFDEDRAAFTGLGYPVEMLGAESDPVAVAQRLYAALRAADAAGADLILAREGVATGMGAAVRDRMRRAAYATVAVDSTP